MLVVCGATLTIPFSGLLLHDYYYRASLSHEVGVRGARALTLFFKVRVGRVVVVDSNIRTSPTTVFRTCHATLNVRFMICTMNSRSVGG